MSVLDAFRDAATGAGTAGAISPTVRDFCAALSLLDKFLHAPLE